MLEITHSLKKIGTPIHFACIESYLLIYMRPGAIFNYFTDLF